MGKLRDSFQMGTRTACGAICGRYQLLARIQPEFSSKPNNDYEDGMSKLRVHSFGMSLDGWREKYGF